MTQKFKYLVGAIKRYGRIYWLFRDDDGIMIEAIEDCISNCCSAPLGGQFGNYVCSDCKEHCEAQLIEIK